MITLKRILVATDFGEASNAALRYGRFLATTFGATLHVLHVTEDVILTAGVEGYLGLAADVQEDIERAARHQTEALLTDDDRRLLKAEAITFTSDRTAAAIVDYARDNHFDLIVLGTHGRGALARVVMGSVAERVARSAPCPVLTVHSVPRASEGPELMATAGHAAAGH